MNPDTVEGIAEAECGSSPVSSFEDSERFDRLRQILSTFNHRCRNSLNGIKMSLYLFKRAVTGRCPAGGASSNGRIAKSRNRSTGSR